MIDGIVFSLVVSIYTEWYIGPPSKQYYILGVMGQGPGEGTPYVWRYIMLGYTWVVFDKFLYFFREMCTFFSTKFQNFFSARWVSILKKNSVFVEQDGTHLQEIFCILFHKVGAIYT